ncbi:peptide deformylase [Formicincola oecophyllae]|uniref:Peptide deformylase n=1 Tax=Formicincola oecophyllae TaxID=2558361 RepID=A0A4Y6UAC4_9PROT|nr:peptide deformylase [Formicincola oecophyllae]QDH13900.1 peptide deformylase [Formicincola oecophyllae]
MSLTELLQNVADAEPATVLVAPHPFLRRKARPVEEADLPTIREALPSLFAALYKAPGIGLAAPQAGIGLRYLIMDLARPDEGEAPAPHLFINPVILESSEELAPYHEGCLSLPNQFADVMRPARVRVRYQDLEGAFVEVEADGLLATCLQHEIDHLDGVLFVDHLSTLKRNMVMRRLEKEQKRRR